ncbi:hypothetical protein GCM10022405_46690 [Gibbsiella dentisursi]|uniref:Uncharacterized protein n=1 Tax=Gibbsiella dentisursi TaxID=796890 RepID=A0ABP7MA28_9GAMM
MKDIITEYLKDDFNKSCLRYCSLTIWNKLKIEMMNNRKIIHESLKSAQPMMETSSGCEVK